MPSIRSSLPGARRLSPLLLACLAIFVVLHGSLIVHDISHPRHFLEGDRGSKRLNKINVILGIDEHIKTGTPPWSKPQHTLTPETARDLSVPEKVLNLGPPGDYIFHAGFYSVAEHLGIIVAQTVLAFIAIICLFRLCLLVGLDERAAFAATILYMLLPSSLSQTHQLVTEALFNPLLVIGTYFLVRSVEEPFRRPLLLSGLLAIAVAMLIRTQLVLYPMVLTAIFYVCYPRDWRRYVVPTLIVCFAIPLAWSLFAWLAPASDHTAATELSLARNLSGLVKRMSMVGGFAFDRSDYANEEIPLLGFLSYVVHHPIAFLYVKVTDAVEILFNPAVTVAGKYLGIDLFRFTTPEGQLFWAQVRARSGVFGVIREIFNQQPLFVVSFLVAVVVWFAILVVAIVGSWRFLGEPKVCPASKAILISLLFYNLAVVQVSEMVRATHRSTVEFIIIIMFAFGVRQLLALRSRAKGQPGPMVGLEPGIGMR